MKAPKISSIAGCAPAIAILSLQLVLWPVSPGIWISGLILGALGALLAFGMALIYRSNTVVSFAQADLGTLPATAAVCAMEAWRMPFWFALPLGVAGSVLLGAMVDLAFIRRFFAAPRLIVTVATIGVGQLLAFASIMLPGAWGLAAAIRTFPPPFEFSVAIGAVLFDANDLIALLVAPIAMIGVATYLRLSDSGVAIRAAATSPDRASLLGIPVKRLQTQVWAIAGGLAFVSTFFTAGVTGLAPGGSFSFGLLLRALAALVLGRMTNLGAIVASSLALGILQNAMERANDGALVGPVLLGIILLALTMQRRTPGRTYESAASTLTNGAGSFAMPKALQSLRPVRILRAALATSMTALALALPLFLGTASTLKAGMVVIFAIIGLSMVVLSGWAGQVSLGQMAFVGTGGAVAATAMAEHHIDPIVACLVAGCVGAVVAGLIGIPALRLSGLHLAVVSLALAAAASSALFSNAVIDFIPRGAFTRPRLLGRVSVDSPERLYYLALGCLAATGIVVSGLRSSRFGRVLIAQRDNERGASSFGIGVVATKLGAFSVSGFIASFAGGLYVLHQSAFRSSEFDPGASLLVFVAAVIGGLASPFGAVLGAVYLRGAQWLLPGNWQVLASSTGVLLVLLMMPDGLGGLWLRTRDFLLNRYVVPRYQPSHDPETERGIQE